MEICLKGCGGYQGRVRLGDPNTKAIALQGFVG